MKKVTVIGAGFAGLTLSQRLAEKGFLVELHESSARVGGLLGTDQTPFGIAERAANALINTEKASQLFKDLGLNASLPLKESRKRFLYRGRPLQWPLSLLETLGFFCKLLSRLVKGKSRLRPRPSQTLEAWGHENIGIPATSFILEPAMQGIYANEISNLSASLILGPLFDGPKKKRGYKGLLTGPGGMQDLIDHLEKKCRDLGVRIHLNSQIDIKETTHPVILTTSAPAAARIIKECSPEVANILQTISMSSIMSITVFFKSPQESFKGFGCLIPRHQNLNALGILMNSYIFKDRNKTYNETWMFGGQQSSELLKKSDAELLEMLLNERKSILQRQDEVLHFKVNRWPQALPFYDINLEKALLKLKETSLPQGLYLHGNYLGGIGLSKILERSHLLADQIESDYV